MLRYTFFNHSLPIDNKNAIMAKGLKMGNIASEEWLIDLARKECTNIHFETKIKIEFLNNCLTAKIIEMPQYLRNIKIAKKRKELTYQLIIVQGLKKYVIALPSKLYKMSIAKECQTSKTNEENNNEENIIKIADNGWIIDLVSKEGLDVQYGLKIKAEFFNDCLTAKIIKMSKDFRNERIPKKEKDILKQCKIVQGLDIYSEAYRSSLVDNKRKRSASMPRAMPKPPPSYEEFSMLPPLPEFPPVSEHMKRFLAKAKLKSSSMPTAKQPSKSKSSPKKKK